MALLAAYVPVRPDTDKFEPDLKRRLKRMNGNRLGGSVGKSIGNGMRVGMAGPLKSMAGLMAGVFAAQQFAGFVKGGFEALGVIEKLGAQTEAVIKSTGGVAGVTRKSLDDLASGIERVTSVEAEAVTEGANFLLTFTNIRNEAGRGNDIFNQTVRAMTDLSVATGTDAKGAALQLGKALNDPIKGVSALSRVGVSFTEGQKKQIAALVESGDVMGAQKVILGELTTQFGGSAKALGETFPGRIAKLRNAFGEVQEQIVAGLLPAAEAVVRWLTDDGIPQFRRIAGLIGDHVVPVFKSFVAGLRGEGPMRGFTGVLNTLGLGLRAVVNAFKDGDVTSDGFVGAMERIGVAAGAAFGYFRSDVLPRLREFAGFIRDDVVPRVRGFVDEVGPRLTAAFRAASGFVTRTLLPAFRVVGGFLRSTFTPTFRALSEFVTGSVLPSLAKLREIVMDNQPQLRTLAKVVLGVAGVAGVLVAKVAGFLLPILLKLAGFLVRTLFAAVGRVIDVIGVLVRTVEVTWKGFQEFGRIVARVWSKFNDVIRAGVRAAVGVFMGMVESILRGAEKAFGWIPGLGDKLRSAREKFATFRDGVNAALSGIKDREVKINAQLDSGARYLAQTRGISASEAAALARKMFAAGGAVRGAGTGTSDSIPAMLSNGEHVWTAEEVRRAGGHAAVEEMRRQFRGYARGGPVRFDVEASLPTSRAFRLIKDDINAGSTSLIRQGTSAVDRLAKALNAQAKATQDTSGRFGSSFPVVGAGGRTYYQGKLFDTPTATRLMAAAAAYGAGWRVTQGSFSTSVGASAGTHAGAGAVDLVPYGSWGGAVGALRRSGFAAWDRLPSQGPWMRHIHGIAIGVPGLSSAAASQVRDYLSGGNGLRGYDRGGMLPPGLTLAYNGTGRAERVRTGASEDAMLAELRAIRQEIATARPSYTLNGVPQLPSVRQLEELDRARAMRRNSRWRH